LQTVEHVLAVAIILVGLLAIVYTVIQAKKGDDGL
jgi:hypothetical protein